jgi:NADPH:quinone reductase-like Zn-dependent oxidoreductase
MNRSVPETMKAAAISRYGGPEVFRTLELPVPQPGPREVLIRLDAAGIGVWDPAFREGEFDGNKRAFPRIIGNDGAGTVVAVGRGVTRVRVGERVYAYTMKGGFYAEYACVKQDEVAAVPRGVKREEAGALGADGITALRGLEELRLKSGETLMIFGASGGIGHIAVQLAKRMGARVFAVASGRDGVKLVQGLGADAAVDGRKPGLDLAAAARRFAPDGIDAALVLVGARGLGKALGALKKGGRVAYPNGVEPAPRARAGIKVHAYDGVPTPKAFDRLNRLIGRNRFRVRLGRVYRLEDAARAHRELGKHHLGKLAFRM